MSIEDTTVPNANFVELTAEIVAAYVANNVVQVAALPDLITSVHTAVLGLSISTVVASEPLEPAVNPKRSVFPDYIVCLDDGKHFRSMKRHLTGLGMTPAGYRAKWGLPADYPMVAPNYAAARSAMAKRIGLGRKAAPKGKATGKSAAKGKASAKASRAKRSA